MQSYNRSSTSRSYFQSNLSLIVLIIPVGIFALVIFLQISENQKQDLSTSGIPSVHSLSPGKQTITNNQNDLRQDKNPKKSKSTNEIKLKNPDKEDNFFSILKTADAEIKHTANNVILFANTGDLSLIRSLDDSQIENFIDYLVENLSKDKLASLIEQYLRIPHYFVLEKDTKSLLSDLSKAIIGDSFQPPPKVSLVFSEDINSDGAILGETHVIPKDSKRVYAVFENTEQLSAKENVYAIWRGLDSNKLEFAEYEPLRISGRFNYVWLEQISGWAPGNYQLDICDPDNHFIILATNTFKIK